MKSRSLLALLVSCIVVTSTMLQANEKRPATAVITAPIEFVATHDRIEAVGTSDAHRSVVLFPAVADRVTKVNFKSAQRVNKGDILFQLDDRKEQAQAKHAQIQLDNAKRDLLRLQNSIKNGATTQSALDDAQTKVALAEVALTQAQNDIADHKVVAAFSGVVGLTDIEAGDWVTNQTKLTTLDDRSILYIDFDAPEQALDLLKDSTHVRVFPWYGNTGPIDAQIAHVDSRIDSQRRTIRIKAAIDNQQDKFIPGMSFKVALMNFGQRYAAIPEAALMWGPTGPYIWIAEQGIAKRVDVQVIQRQKNHVLVDGNIAQQQMLVVEGVQRLREGQAINPQLAKVN
ncbi:efflux RND transporter periplasmic adaptor subunit [Pseudoalteromonas sp. T1lg23B]|uniref:efflux RND transporter periplasmic adaptor subunit n=1 Tax=Pseudoalteromonas sp. T1lg23B TaxID=2077097 RepID=UPI001F19F407|nr:efflux RND transporter periplasmic adaptor subunit [Pseudoalteromonas sp. T1lg23B]